MFSGKSAGENIISPRKKLFKRTCDKKRTNRQNFELPDYVSWAKEFSLSCKTEVQSSKVDQGGTINSLNSVAKSQNLGLNAGIPAAAGAKIALSVG